MTLQLTPPPPRPCKAETVQVPRFHPELGEWKDTGGGLQFIPAPMLFETRQVYEPLGERAKMTPYIAGGQREHLINGKKQLRDGVTGGLVKDAFP